MCFYTIQLSVLLCIDTKGNATCSQDSSDTGVKVIITVTIFVVAVIAAIVIARLVDRCYDKRVLEDEDDMSENMRDLIRVRLSVIQHRKRDHQRVKQNKVIKVFKQWADKVKNRATSREAALNAKRPPGGEDDVIITVDKAVSDKKQNGSPRTPRFPFFTGGSQAGGSQKPPNSPKVLRKRPSPKMDRRLSVPAVQKGRPVSSNTARAFPNVIVTSVDGNSSNVLPKPQVVVEADSTNMTTMVKQNGMKS